MEVSLLEPYGVQGGLQVSWVLVCEGRHSGSVLVYCLEYDLREKRSCSHLRAW